MELPKLRSVESMLGDILPITTASFLYMFSFEVEREKQTWYRLYFRCASVVLNPD